MILPLATAAVYDLLSEILKRRLLRDHGDATFHIRNGAFTIATMVHRAFRCTSIAIDWHSCHARWDFVDLVDGRSRSAASAARNSREALQPE